MLSVDVIIFIVVKETIASVNGNFVDLSTTVPVVCLKQSQDDSCIKKVNINRILFKDGDF